MIILDTHVWIWWVHHDNQLTEKYRNHIQHNEADGLGISVFACWEVAKLVELKRLILHCPLDEWMKTASSQTR